MNFWIKLIGATLALAGIIYGIIVGFSTAIKILS